MWIIQARNGQYVAPSGDLTDFASEALGFALCADAVRFSFRYIASKTIEINGRRLEYEAMNLRQEEPLFEDHVYACLSDTDLLNLLTSKVAN